MIYFIWHLLFTLMRKSKALYANTHTHWNMPSICWECFSFVGVSKTVFSPFDCLSAKAY